MIFSKARLIDSPPEQAFQAILEAIEEEVPLIVSQTEGFPLKDLATIRSSLKRSRLMGPGSAGLVIPGLCHWGLLPVSLVQKGSIAVVTSSKSLGFAAVSELTQGGFGLSAFIGLGAHPLRDFSFQEALDYLEADAQTKAIVVIGCEESLRPSQKPIVALMSQLKSAFVPETIAHLSETITKILYPSKVSWAVL